MDNKISIRISDVLEKLHDGYTRDEIAQEYGLTPYQLKVLFKNEKLKGVRSRKKHNLDIIDDTEENVEQENEEVVLENTEDVQEEEETVEETETETNYWNNKI